MSELIFLLSTLALLGLYNFYCSILILRRLKVVKGVLSFIELRWQVHKHMKDYCHVTRSEDGRIGAAFYGYWISLILMIGLVLWLLLQTGT